MEPQGALNVGSTCRAMKNFGLSELVVVRPGCELDLDAIRMALHARDILESARIVQTVEEAVAGSVLVLGTSNRHGEYHEPHMAVRDGLERIGSVLQNGIVTILFGREEWGLTKDDLRWTQGTIHVVTHPKFTSLNLSQAVLLIAYELFQAFGNQAPPIRRHAGDPYEEPPTVEELHRLYKHMGSVLSLCEFLPKSNPDALFQVIRAFISRARAKRREINILMGIFSNVDGFMRKYVRSKAKTPLPRPPQEMGSEPRLPAPPQAPESVPEPVRGKEATPGVTMGSRPSAKRKRKKPAGDGSDGPT